jgi:zinc protease
MRIILKTLPRLFLFFAFSVSMASIAQTGLKDPLPIDPKVKMGKLENGLTYFIRENKKPEQKVELRLVINAGSILEDNDQQGLAHMAEHMAFNGTKNFKENEIVSYLQSIGVGFGNDLNAYTSFNETVYMLPIPTDKPGNVEKGFQILEDWAHQVTYNDKDINDERNVILEESRQGQGAQERMRRKWLPGLFAGSKYANRLPIGIDSIISTFKPDAIRRFYKEWYRPNLMAVIVVGDIGNKEAEELVKKHFAHLKNPANPRPREMASLNPYAQNKAIVVTDQEATNYSIAVYYSAIPSKQSSTLGEYRNDIVKQLFAGLVNQRLRDLTQKENPPFLAAGLGFSNLARGYEQPYVSVITGENDTKRGLEATLEEVERVKRYGFTAPELERIKKSTLAGIERMHNERDKSESMDFVEEYIGHFLEGEAIPGIENEYKYYQALMPSITLEDLNAMAKKIAEGSGTFYAMLLGPQPSATVKLPTAEELIAINMAVAKKDVKPYEEKAIAASLISKMPVAGKIVSETKDATWGATVWELSNGVKVTVKKTDYKNDQIIMGARRAGGIGNYPLAEKYNANYATAVAEAMGIGEFSPTDLQKALSGKVASARAVLSGTFDGFSGSSNVKDLETMMQLLYLRATSPRTDTALFRSFVQRSKSQMAFAMSNPQTAFIDTLINAMYDNNPLAPIAVPKAEYYDKINMDKALAIYRERLGDASGMHFVFVGSIDEAVLKPLVETYIASLPASGKKFEWKDQGVRMTKGKKQLDFYKGQAQQSLILAFHSGEVPYSEDLELKADAISEILNIRIIEELREKIQGIYSGGTSASVEKIPYNNFQIVFQLPCGPEKIDTLLLAMNAEIESLKKNGPTEEVLNKVKQQWVEAYKTSLQENGTWLNRILRDRFPGAEADRFLNYEKYVAALTPAQIKVAANILLGGQNVFTAILRPEVKKEEKK